MDEDGALDARGESLRPVPVRRPDAPRHLQAGRRIRKVRLKPSDWIIIASAKAPARSIPAPPAKPHSHGCRQQPGHVTVSWTAATGAHGHELWRATSAAGACGRVFHGTARSFKGLSLRKGTAHSGLQTGRDSPLPRAVLRIQVQHSKRAGDASSKSRRGCPRRPG